mmetsp:Transcript_14806/g.27402  ORF Transcript_14806/g.27402 Transcript_14806/m.27402 type:complete len:110 (-) Transcript_14806:6-335(-)
MSSKILHTVTREKQTVAEELDSLEERLIVGLPRLSQRLKAAKYKLGISSTQMLGLTKDSYEITIRADALKKDLSSKIKAAQEVMAELSRAKEEETQTFKPKFRVVVTPQ